MQLFSFGETTSFGGRHFTQVVFLSATKLFPDDPWEVPAGEDVSPTKYFPDKPWNVPTGDDVDSDE